MVATVARKKPVTEPRDRIDLRADPELVARLRRQSARFGLAVSAYIRQAINKQLEADESTPPPARPRG